MPVAYCLISHGQTPEKEIRPKSDARHRPAFTGQPGGGTETVREKEGFAYS